MGRNNNTDIIEGRQPVLELFRSGRPINQIYVAKGDRQGSIRKILRLAKKHQVVVKEVKRDYLDTMSQTRNHQGVIAQIAPIKYCDLEDLLTRSKAGFYLVLAGIQDPYNLGSLIRSAEICGVDGVIIPKRRAVGVTAVVAKASAGAVSHLPICRVTNIVDTLKRLKEAGCWVVGADMDGEICYKQDLTQPAALVIGGEGSGLPRLVKETCDFLVRIPLHGSIGSFNAAVAGGILMYEIARQKNGQL